MHTVNEIEVKFTSEKEKEFVTATKNCEVLSKITQIIQNGWPKTQEILGVN